MRGARGPAVCALTLREAAAIVPPDPHDRFPGPARGGRALRGVHRARRLRAGPGVRERPDGAWHRHFEIVTVAEKAGPVKAGEGPTTHADYAFSDAPAYDILLVPGGFGTRQALHN